MQKALLVGIGGFIGSISRYGLSRLINEAVLMRTFPFATFTINIVGSFLLGIIYGATLKRTEQAETINLLLGIGFCGGFTTFSTFALENMRLIEQRDVMSSMIYSLASCIISIVAVWGGFSLSRNLF